MSKVEPILEKTFCVIIPTYNRASFLPRTLNSLLNQTYGHWVCWIIDDGSTDDSPDVISSYIDLDERFNSIRLPENRGGVAANELGMKIACSTSSWWTRLGSDDTFLPHKLEIDVQALRHHDATFGPFMQESIDGKPEKILSRPMTSQQTRIHLERPNSFAGSWANVAVRTCALRAVEQRFGSYVDPRLRNMEDKLFNFRLSCITDWVWRGRITGELVIGPAANVCRKHASGVGIEHDATWTRNPVGATASTEWTRYDAELSCGIIAAEHHAILWPDPTRESASKFANPVPCHNPADKIPEGLDELAARRFIGELLRTKATCNWNFVEHGDRLGKIWEIGSKTAALTGSVVELGVARGGTARLLSAMFPQKTIYAIDGFEGLVDFDPRFDILPAETFSEIDVETTRKALQDCENIILYHGKFPAIIDSKLRDETFSLVHLDTDTYVSTRTGLEFFLPRLVNGGMIFVNDYGWDQAPGVQRAVDELMPLWPALSLCRTTPVQALLQATTCHATTSLAAEL